MLMPSSFTLLEKPIRFHPPQNENSEFEIRIQESRNQVLNFLCQLSSKVQAFAMPLDSHFTATPEFREEAIVCLRRGWRLGAWPDGTSLERLRNGLVYLARGED